jgi:hypothetical protein
VRQGVERLEVVGVSDDDLEGATIRAEGCDFVFEGDLDGDQVFESG